MDAEKSDNSSFEDLSNLKEISKIAEELKSPKSAASDFARSEQGFEEASRARKSDMEKNLDDDDDDEDLPPLEETHSKQPDEVKSNSGATEKDDDPAVIDILGNGQLVKRILVAGHSDKRPGQGELVTIEITGQLEDGTVVEKVENLQIHVGDMEIIQGVDMAIPLMNVGETAEIKVSARLAYGSLGFKSEQNPDLTIPPDSNLVYIVHLISSTIEDFKDLKKFETRRKYGTKKKERANFWYNRGEYPLAVHLYRRALDYLDDRDGDPDSDSEDLYTNEESQKLLDDRLIVYNNLAMAQIKMGVFDAALKSVENVLMCQPDNAKALYRKGRILDAKGDTKGAIALLQKAASLEKDTRIIQQDLAKLMIKQRREENNEKEMYQKMLGQAKKLEQKTKSTKPASPVDNSKLKMVCYVLGSILIGVAGAAIYRYKY